jgi:hypothetical protein
LTYSLTALSREILVDRPERSSIKQWLGLVLLVLLIHLLLLQTLPITLTSFTPLSSPMSFVVRTVQTPTAPRAEPERPIKTVPAPAQAQIPQPRAPATDHTADSTTPEVNRVDDSVSPEEVAAITHTRLAEQTQTAAPAPVPTPKDTQVNALAYDASTVPESVKLTYEVHTNKFPFSLNGELVWYHSDARYRATATYDLVIQKRSQTSVGKLGHEGLLPDRFSDKLRSELAAHFNREQNKITFSANTPDAVLESGAQDRLSVLIQIATLMASAPNRFAPGNTLSIQTVGPRAADIWLFTLGTSEKLQLPGGTLDAVKITRAPRQTYDQQLDIWMAPKLGYLPARIRITEANGDYVDQKWLRSEPNDSP